MICAADVAVYKAHMLKYLAIILACLMLATPAFAGDGAEKSFVKKRYSIKGSAKVEMVEGQSQLVFSDDFKTKNGPDLKVYLSKLPIEELTAKTVNKSSIRLSVLKSNKGAQSYSIPDDIDLNDYQSVIIHCQAYSVLWGGFDL